MALLFGGQSAEHEVSIRSARSVFEALDKDKFDVLPILISQEGGWYIRPQEISTFDPDVAPKEHERVLLSPDPLHSGFVRIQNGAGGDSVAVDVVFPVLHGTFGEDGTVQGLLDLAGLPYVGCGVLASAVGLDKVMMKCAFHYCGLEVGPFFWFLRSQWRDDPESIFRRVKERLDRFPLFVKPANLGSSVGITKVMDPADFENAVDLATLYDRKVIVEDGIPGRELEVSVLGNDNPVASLPGEIIPHADFYDYTTKYIDDTAELVIPADLPDDIKAWAADVAVTAFKAVDGAGLARVDMFLTPDNRMVVNEINTLPGFTSISMYPKLWEATGIPYRVLVEKLIDLALERHRDKRQILTRRQ